MLNDMTTIDAAARLGVTRPALMRMVKEGLIPAHDVNGHTRLKFDDVTAFIEARKQRRVRAFKELRDLLDEEE